MKLISEQIENVEYLVEGEGDKKSVYIVGNFLAPGVVNGNGRYYPPQTLAKEVERYVKEAVEQNCAYGELGHPAGPGINLDRVSHMIKELKLSGDGKHYVGKAKVTDTPMGNIAKALISEGARLGVSSRGVGTLKEDPARGCMVVQDDFRIMAGADIVADPSGPGCFVKGIMEGADWALDPATGNWRKLEAIDELRQDLHRKTKSQLQEQTLQAWERFLSIILAK